MSNICCFRMRVKGDKLNISKFTSALTQAGNIWMGRGAQADIDFLSDSEAEIEGCCKWSIQSALIDDSFSMRRQKETGEGYWGDLDTSKGFILFLRRAKNITSIWRFIPRNPGVVFQSIIHTMTEKF